LVRFCRNGRKALGEQEWPRLLEAQRDHLLVPSACDARTS
jgi:hypothetical protein